MMMKRRASPLNCQSSRVDKIAYLIDKIYLLGLQSYLFQFIRFTFLYFVGFCVLHYNVFKKPPITQDCHRQAAASSDVRNVSNRSLAASHERCSANREGHTEVRPRFDTAPSH